MNNKEKFFPDDITGFWEKAIYIKMYFGWAWSWIVFPLAIVNGITGLLTFLKVFGWWNPKVVGIAGTLLFGVIIWFGWILKNKNVVQREQDIAARYNPPLQKLLQNTHKDESIS